VVTSVHLYVRLKDGIMRRLGDVTPAQIVRDARE
jgi:hypothetical protein